jgi:hypothetical protein
MDLQTLLKQVEDRESFFVFVRALIADRKNVQSWENTTIERFLSVALAWAEDSDMGTTQGLPQEPTWKAFAVFLYSGKIYE